jgi:hypothetical protein
MPPLRVLDKIIEDKACNVLIRVLREKTTLNERGFFIAYFKRYLLGVLVFLW